jgi:SOS-response transcriptional repressor LexA
MSETDKLISFYDEHERVPTYEEMKKLFGVKSKNTVAYKVKRLVDEGVLIKEGRRLVMGIVGGFMKLGTIQAGFPTTEDATETIEKVSLDRMLMRRKGRTFLLEVQGESMKDAGIFDGDLVVVERGREPLKGDIVVAQIDDSEFTLKYFNIERGKPVLIPANKKFKKIYPDPDRLRIEAVASAVVRRYF